MSLKETRYAISTDVRYAALERFDVGAIVAATSERWHNQTLVRANDSVLRLGVLEGAFHWHRHEREDEVFFVLEGELFVDIDEHAREVADAVEGRVVTLAAGQGICVPRGVVHRTRAPEKVVVLMLASSTVVPTGD